MAKYECCGMVVKNGPELAEHMRGVHKALGFRVELACCGKNFAESRELKEHVLAEHGAPITVEI
jgi:hypothetical protein